MRRYLALCERCVAAGIRAYIELLAYGELKRSRLLLHDVLTLSTTVSGGPSTRAGAVIGNTASNPGPSAPDASARFAAPGRMGQVVAESTARSMLATLLVLRTTSYWPRIPVLQTLLDSATRLGSLAGRAINSCSHNCREERGDSDGTEPFCGCRRSRTLPGGPVAVGVDEPVATRMSDRSTLPRGRE